MGRGGEAFKLAEKLRVELKEASVIPCREHGGSL